MDNDPEDASKPAKEAPAEPVPNLKPADLNLKDEHAADRSPVSGSTASEREPPWDTFPNLFAPSSR